ncbi:hypothetical protein AAGW05_13270 [Arthrobacter sp. LAPM80]|uniref:hypothetical protein n=1 Tax=Arthrobacter sp. LAPM80 TaxID=3141788 RepID=UPI00398B999F
MSMETALITVRGRLAVEDAIARFGSVARHHELQAIGISTRQIADAVTAGRICRVARGHYALPGFNELDVFLARNQARLACLSRLKGLGLWVLREPRDLHVATAHGRPVPGCTAHRTAGPETFMAVVRQAVGCGSDLDGLITMESAVVKNKCTIEELRMEFDRRSDKRAREMIALIDPQSMSITETAGRHHLLRAGHNVVAQAYVREVGHLDLLVDGILGIEGDGREFHATAEAWKEDLRRDAMYVLNGVWRLRLPAEVVLYHPEVFLNYVERALARIRCAQRPSA